MNGSGHPATPSIAKWEEPPSSRQSLWEQHMKNQVDFKFPLISDSLTDRIQLHSIEMHISPVWLKSRSPGPSQVTWPWYAWTYSCHRPHVCRERVYKQTQPSSLHRSKWYLGESGNIWQLSSQVGQPFFRFKARANFCGNTRLKQ